MKRFFVTCAVVAMALGILAAASLAGEKEGEQAYDPAMMEAWQKAMTPGKHHAHFDGLVGDWTTKVTVWNTPEADPVVTEGTAVYKTIYDGRFLLQKTEGLVMGMPHKGMGMSGYDNVKEKHTVYWIDNMGTGMIYSEGECADHCKVLTHYAMYPDPMTGKDMKFKMVSSIVSDDQHVFVWYTIEEDGDEFKMMEIVYSRVAEAKG